MAGTILTFVLTACKKDFTPVAEKENNTAVFPTAQKDQQRVAVIKEVADILKVVYSKPKAVQEVVATIRTEYYVDERVLLKDLLTPETSPVYETEKFRTSGVEKGVFKTAFFEAYAKGDYPNLKEALKPTASNHRTLEQGIDPKHEIWTNSNGVSIYFPYSEDFPGINPNDPSNNTENGNLITIVAADRHADSGPGDEPYYCFADATFTSYTVCYRPVTVNDAYAESRPTNIVGMGAHPARIMRDPPPPSANVNRVFVGWIRLQNKQYDRLISFNSANGGGSEVKVCRISGYLQFQNQQVTNFTGDAVEVNIKRRDITRKNWHRFYSVWDEDWVTANTEQVVAVYEEDSEGTETFSGSLSTTVRIDTGTTASGNIGYNVTVKTQDELILQTKYSRSGYFGAAKYDQAWGFQMCDGRTGYCRYDDYFNSRWPIYNGGANWSFTFPFNSY